MARILLADDDKGARDLVRRALEMDGHTVTLAEDGNDAVTAIEAGGFDAIVADIEMPGVDGVEVARRALGLANPIRVVLISGSHELLDRGRALSSKGVRLLVKPFTIDAIRAEVRAVLKA